MSSEGLPALHELLPAVKVDGAVLQHIRTLLYSSTRDHEHVANVSIYHSGDSKNIKICSLLPTAPQPGIGRIANDPSASSDGSSVSLDTPLLSRLTSKPPPVRRPTHSVSSLLSLFPPSATCQASPPLQIHVTFPNVRLSLSQAIDLRSSSVTLVSNSLYILLTTGQTSEKAGLMLTSQSKHLSRKSAETLEPAQFSASGRIAGVWVQGNHPKVATLALHALAAAWWTRRNHRVNPKPVAKNLSGAWYERRVWLVRFLTDSSVTIQNGIISVCDDAGTHYIASLLDSDSEVQFETTVSEEAGHQSGTVGSNWQSGWVIAPTPRETREAEMRLRERSRSSRVASASSQSSDAHSSSRVHLSTSKRKENRNLSGKKRDQSSNRSVDTRDNESTIDDDLLNMRMQAPSFRRCDEIVSLHSQRHTTFDKGAAQETNRKPPVNQQPGRVLSVDDRRRTLDFDGDSESELGETDESFMENLCKKYLHGNYADETKKHLRNSQSTSSSKRK